MNDSIRYECIDPDLGQHLGSLDDPTADDALKRRLVVHCESCASCRFQREVSAKIEAGLGDGGLSADVIDGRSRWRQRTMIGAGWLSLAASLVLMLMMPPRAPEQGGVMRAESDRPGLIRPVAEEVVGANPLIRWTVIEKATAYQVTVASDDGSFSWSERSRESQIKVPDESALPVGQSYWVKVEPVPAHLASEGGMRGVFRTGQVFEIVRYRVGRAPLGVTTLSFLGLLLMVGGWLSRFSWREFNHKH